MYPIYNHNLRNISTVYICNKTGIKRNILTIKQNILGSRSGQGLISTPVVLQRVISSPPPPPRQQESVVMELSRITHTHTLTLRIMRLTTTPPTLSQSRCKFFTRIEAAFSWSSSRRLYISTTVAASLSGKMCSTVSFPNSGNPLTGRTSANEDTRSSAVERQALFERKRWQENWAHINHGTTQNFVTLSCILSIILRADFRFQMIDLHVCKFWNICHYNTQRKSSFAQHCMNRNSVFFYGEGDFIVNKSYLRTR